MEKNCGEYVFCKACTSFLDRRSADRVAETLAYELVKKSMLKELRVRMEKAFTFLTDKEKFLLELRYFRRKKILRRYKEQFGGVSIGSARTYFREQVRTVDKLSKLFDRCGLTEEKMEEYMEIEELRMILHIVTRGLKKGKKRSNTELRKTAETVA